MESTHAAVKKVTETEFAKKTASIPKNVGFKPKFLKSLATNR